MVPKLSIRNKEIDRKITVCFFLLLFVVMSIIYLYPMFWAVINSLKTAREFFDSSFGLPKEWRFVNYVRVFTDFHYRNFSYWDMLFNSLWYLVVKVTVNVLSSAFLAYAVARYRFPGRNLIYAVVIFANTVPIIGSGAAGFKLIDSLNMVNNPFLIWIAWAGGFDFAFIVLYGTFKGISMSYSESAKMDGANNFTILFRIVFPQAFPSLVALAITQAIGVWNDYSTSMIYLRDYPNLAYGIYVFGNESNYIENSKAIYMAAIVISAIPVLVLYASFQKLIMTNMTTGGLKG